MKQHIKRIYIDLYCRWRTFSKYIRKMEGFKFFDLKFMTKKRLGVLLTAALPLYVWMGSGMFIFDPSGEKKELVLAAQTAVNPSSLSQEETAIYANLGPIYQKIYTLAFNSEERTRVGVYVRRGQTPYEAIDTILRSEERKYLRAHPKKTYQSPAEKATAKNAKSTKNTTVF